MRRLILLAAALAASPSLALAADVPKEAPQATIGGCVWAAKPDLLKAYRKAIPSSYDLSKVAKARGDFLTAHQPELLAQAALCEKRGDVSPTVSMLAIAAEATMQDDQLWVSPFDPFSRKELNRIWTEASEGTRQCIRSQVNKALGLAAPDCANPKSADSLPQAIAQVSRSKNNSFNGQFSQLESQTAVEYFQAYARAELAEASFTRMAPPAAGAPP